MDIFDAILAANKPTGTIDTWQYGIVAKNNDPLKLGRLQVYDQAKGGKHLSDWLMRALPFTSFTPPVPKPGDLVLFGYINGDPHTGCYSGVVVNNVNPSVGGDEDITVVLGDTVVSITKDGKVNVTGATEVNVSSTKVTLTATDTITINTPVLNINSPTFSLVSTTLSMSGSGLSVSPGTLKVSGKDIATVGASDTRGDTLVTKGY